MFQLIKLGLGKWQGNQFTISWFGEERREAYSSATEQDVPRCCQLIFIGG
jgi:hypothetical protein